MTEFSMKLEGWRKAPQKAGRWSGPIEDWAEAIIRKSHDAESCRAAERHAKGAATPPTVGISMRRWGRGGSGGGGDVLP